MSKVQELNITEVIAYQENLGRETPLSLVGRDKETAESSTFSDSSDLASLMSSVGEGYAQGCAMPLVEKIVHAEKAQLTLDWLLSQAAARTVGNSEAPIELALGGIYAGAEDKARKVKLYLSTLASVYSERMASKGGAKFTTIAGNRRFWALLALEAVARDNKEASIPRPDVWSYIVETYATDAQRRRASIQENAHRSRGARDLNLRDFALLGLEHARAHYDASQTRLTESQLARAFGLESQGKDRSAAQVMHVLSVYDFGSRFPNPLPDQDATGAEPYDLLSKLRGAPDILRKMTGAKAKLIEGKAGLASAPIAAWQAACTATIEGIIVKTDGPKMATKTDLASKTASARCNLASIIALGIIKGDLSAFDHLARLSETINNLMPLDDEGKAARAELAKMVKG